MWLGTCLVGIRTHSQPHLAWWRSTFVLIYPSPGARTFDLADFRFSSYLSKVASKIKMVPSFRIGSNMADDRNLLQRSCPLFPLFPPPLHFFSLRFFATDVVRITKRTHHQWLTWFSLCLQVQKIPPPLSRPFSPFSPLFLCSSLTFSFFL